MVLVIKRGGEIWELVVAAWTSSRQFSHEWWPLVYRPPQWKACHPGSRRKLPPPAYQVQPELHSSPGFGVIRCSQMHFLCTQSLQKILLLPTSVQTAHEYSPELCRRPWPVPQIITVVFPAFTLNPFSMASIHIKSLLTHSFSESAMMTRSSANNSRAKLTWKSLQHNDEEQGTESISLVDPYLHIKLLAVILANMSPDLSIGLRSLDLLQNPCLGTYMYLSHGTGLSWMRGVWKLLIINIFTT